MGDVTSQERNRERTPGRGSHPVRDAGPALRGAPDSGGEGGSDRPVPDGACRERGQPQDLWPVARALARAFDAQGVPREQQWTLRVLKLSEETGEAAQAVIGVQGTNPRKGYSHAWEDVHAEVADVVITGLVSLARMRPDDAADYLRRQLVRKAARFPAAGRSGAEPFPQDGG
ncbi:hypothetical protein [Streptomyces qinglanensis]|uniref:hypothetical protein n=1 Tax=Streptomyces qinglanensis TaxID=943816 RepID=UPI003D7387E9